MVIDTTDITPAEAAQQILLYLESEGFISPSPAGNGGKDNS
jgi:hypothetical protein